jgi:hypothetical protein
MSTRLFAGLLAGALMVPQAALSAEVDTFRLPPVPYAETITWLTAATQQKPRSYLGLLLAPRPLVLTPTEFASVPIPNQTSLSTQLAIDTHSFRE